MASSPRTLHSGITGGDRGEAPPGSAGRGCSVSSPPSPRFASVPAGGPSPPNPPRCGCCLTQRGDVFLGVFALRFALVFALRARWRFGWLWSCCERRVAGIGDAVKGALPALNAGNAPFAALACCERAFHSIAQPRPARLPSAERSAAGGAGCVPTAGWRPPSLRRVLAHGGLPAWLSVDLAKPDHAVSRGPCTSTPLPR